MLSAFYCAWSFPLDVVLANLADQAYAFENVRDVVDAPFLHS